MRRPLIVRTGSKVRLSRIFFSYRKGRPGAAGIFYPMKRIFASLAGLMLLSPAFSQVSAVQQSMLGSFVKYASIDSQSSYHSESTPGQRDIALAIKSDVDSLAGVYGAKDVKCSVSDENYVYVSVPSNIKAQCPSLGISCHLDVTPEAPGGKIVPIVDTKDGHTIVRTDGSTLLGADDKCGCAIAMELIRAMLSDKKIRHGEVMFAFCPNEDVGRAAEAIDVARFNPDILFDIDGKGGEIITESNFTARGFNVKFIGRDAHPADAKIEKLGDATAAAATFISYFPVEIRPENTEGRQGYIHPWKFEQEKDEIDVTVQTRVRYFDAAEGEYFDRLLKEAIAKVESEFPNVGVEVVFDGLQYENVAYTIHPKAKELVEKAARKTGKHISFDDERGGTTASMFAAKGLKGGMCLFSGQHEIHSTREYADLQEMEDAYRLMLEIIKDIPSIK